MRRAPRIPSVLMLVMLVVHVTVIVRDPRVSVLVIVPLTEVQPQTNAHERAGAEQLSSQVVVEKYHGNHRSHKGSDRKVGAGARGPQVPQAKHEQNQA
jgi:hypothetical protein